jgi:hypothetical protein
MDDRELRKRVKILEKILAKRSQIKNLQNKIEKLYEDIGVLRAYEVQLNKKQRQLHQNKWKNN